MMDAIQAAQMSAFSGGLGGAPGPRGAGHFGGAGLAGLGLPRELGSATASEAEQIRVAAQQFETMLVRMMLKEMRETIPDEGGLIEKSAGERMFQDLMDDELAADLSQGMHLGLADALTRQLTRNRLEIGRTSENAIDRP